MKLVLWSCTGMGNTLVAIKGKIKPVYLDINWNGLPSNKIQLVLWYWTGMGLYWYSKSGKSTLVSLEIHWNQFPSSKIQIILWYCTGMGIPLVPNKEEINAWQFRDKLEQIYKQWNTACFVVLNRDGGCIGPQQG